MKVKNLLPIRRKAAHGDLAERHEGNPFLALHREMNRLFDEFFNEFSLVPSRAWRRIGFPEVKVDMTENDKELLITAEVPGLEEKDLDVSLSRGVLSIRGERKEEKKKETENYYYMERSSGTFHRELPLPDYVDIDKADAVLKNGVLRVTLPKKPEYVEARKSIKIKSE